MQYTEAPGVRSQFGNCGTSNDSVSVTATGETNDLSSLGGFDGTDFPDFDGDDAATGLSVAVWVVVVLAGVLPVIIALAVLWCCCCCGGCPLYHKVRRCHFFALLSIFQDILRCAPCGAPEAPSEYAPVLLHVQRILLVYLLLV